MSISPQNRDSTCCGLGAGLYPISSSPYSDEWGHPRLASSFLEGGATIVQIREKQMSDAALIPIVRNILKKCRLVGATLIVNDRVDVARRSGADGVHLGQSDVPPGEARNCLGERAVIGLSTHDEDQFLAAQLEPIDYVALGPIFQTRTKADSQPAVGLELLGRLAPGSRVPVVAIGGLHLRHATAVWRAGAAAVAVISDVCGAPDPCHQVRSYLQKRETEHGLG